jgi:hypothetical protein
MTTYSRRDALKLTREVLGQFHALILNGNLPGFEALLAQYQSEMPAKVKKDLIEEFTRLSAEALRRQWRSSK